MVLNHPRRVFDVRPIKESVTACALRPHVVLLPASSPATSRDKMPTIERIFAETWANFAAGDTLINKNPMGEPTTLTPRAGLA